jgi:hypothetical protein
LRARNPQAIPHTPFIVAYPRHQVITCLEQPPLSRRWGVHTIRSCSRRHTQLAYDPVHADTRSSQKSSIFKSLLFVLWTKFEAGHPLQTLEHQSSFADNLLERAPFKINGENAPCLWAASLVSANSVCGLGRVHLALAQKRGQVVLVDGVRVLLRLEAESSVTRVPETTTAAAHVSVGVEWECRRESCAKKSESPRDLRLQGFMESARKSGCRGKIETKRASTPSAVQVMHMLISVRKVVRCMQM